jgi:hypothetical protein
MSKIIELLNKGYRIGASRVREQGLGTTLLWLYGRGLPAITGVPLLQYSQVTPQLFVGPQYRKPGLKHLQKNGINAVVNMRVEHDDQTHGLAPSFYCYLPTIDDDAPTIEHLQKGVDFISGAVNAGEKVYIHCGAGVGRAPTMAAAYLISTGLTLEAAIHTIKKVRPFIYIMPPQMAILRQWEAKHLRP